MPPSSDQQDAPHGSLRLAPGARVAEDHLAFEFVLSSGPGGQNVNKRATKARLRVPIDRIEMPAAARARLRRLAGSQLNDAGELVIAADEERSQRRNREAALARLRTLVARAMVRPTPRKKTKPSRGSIERRLKAKRERGETKARRRFRPGGGDG